MDASLLLIVGSQVIFYAATAWVIYIMRQRMKQLRERNALEEALLPQQPAVVEHRVDAVSRDAADGFQSCGYCAFANYKRSRFCALCGYALKITLCSVVESSGATTRQRRARRRREWTRSIDIEARPFWFRASVPGSETMFPGYTIRFHVIEPENEQTDHVDADNKTRATFNLAREVASVKMEMVEASLSNPYQFPTSNPMEPMSTQRMQDVVELAGKDFPTKYSHFVVCTASMLVPAEVEYLKISVHRDFLVEESIEHFSCIEEKHMRSIMRINFLDEIGVDAGGVHREWFQLLSEKLVEPTLGLFRCCDPGEQTYYLQSHVSTTTSREQHLAYMFAAGRLVGRALLEGDVLGFHFSLPLLKIILGIPISFSDLEFVDREAYKNMTWLLDNDHVESLGLDFTLTIRDGTVTRIVELVPNGHTIAVTDENKREFLDRRFRYTLFESVSDELYVFLKAIYQVIPQHLLMLLDPEELDFILCGSQEIDVTDWERHTKTSANLKDSRVQRWFWELVREMPNELRQRLLQFATGCSRVPLVGFQGLTSYDGRICPFTLKGVPYDKSQFIRSHACFNRLDLPLYPSRQELKDVLYGTLEADIYGFTFD